MTFKQFKIDYLIPGKKIDWDQTANVQCVDLIKAMLECCFGVPCKKGQAPWGNAEAYYRCFNTKSWGGYDKLQPWLFRIKNTKEFVPLEGDICVWGKNYSDNHDCGHIAIATGTGDTKTFKVWEQNRTGKNDGVALNNQTYGKDFKGVLRPYYKTTAGSLNVRSSPTTESNIVNVLLFNTKIAITEVKNGFGKIGENQWVLLGYTTILTK